MARRLLVKVASGLATGALLSDALVGVFALGSLAGIAMVPFAFFEWLIRVLPGRVVLFGLDTTVGALQGLGFNIKDTAKTAEQVLALVVIFLAGLLVALLFFLVARRATRWRVNVYGLAVGGCLGAFFATITLLEREAGSVAGAVGLAIWASALFLLWGWGVARLHLLAFPPTQKQPRVVTSPLPAGGEPATEVEARSQAEVHVLSRRRFIIEMGGVAATIILAGAGLGAVLRAESQIESGAAPGPAIPLPNALSGIEPVPGTRSEYTPVSDHFRVDIDLDAPVIDETTWRLKVDGLVTTPLSLTLAQLRSEYAATDQFVTLECVSNIVGGPLIGTTLWTGTPFRDVLKTAGSAATARWAHLQAADDFVEQVELDLVNSDPRILLVYDWNRQPLTAKHGFPLRIYIPDVYGMKQPKWITGITLAADSRPGYWVSEGWDEKAEVKITTVLDIVGLRTLVTRGGQTYVPVGGIAYSGAKGISKVEVQVDDEPWQEATLRQPLSELTWVIWRFDWPFSPGDHQLTFRSYDGNGHAQDPTKNDAFPSGATGLFSEMWTVPQS